MTPYRAPVRDIALALQAVGAAEVCDLETPIELVQEFGRYCEQVVAPLNQGGDEHGVRFDPVAGTVTTAPGWRAAYERYVGAGWNSVSFAEEHGGGGFPSVVTTAMQEELNAASMAFALCPMLTQGAAHLLSRHGDEQQQAVHLPALVTGASTGTMLLTEAGAGSDVGALTTRAERGTAGEWRLTGQKIFITYGEHDLTDQTVHLVLARLPDAPAGARGVSCFLVPKVLPDGARNAIACIGVEEKMGIHASPTCTMQLDGAVGELVGEAHGGMRAMFTMMNTARLSVAVEGLGVAVRAQQAAADHARGRVQGRPVGRHDGAPIAEHPDVRRMLLHMRSHVDAMRLLVLRTAVATDAGDAAMADLLTPLAKAWCTDTGSEVARLATQVMGGTGYIREAGVEQHERDVRIASIYEGTNGIQAVDLVSRKLRAGDGRALADAMANVRTNADAFGGPAGSHLVRAAATLEEATAFVLDAWERDPRDALAAATPYLRLTSTVIAGGLLAAQAVVARQGGTGEPFVVAKVAAAEYFLTQVVPHAAGLATAITAGCGVLDAVDLAML